MSALLTLAAALALTPSPAAPHTFRPPDFTAQTRLAPPPRERVQRAPRPLRLTAPDAALTTPAPPIEVRPKAEWSDDQGFSFDFTKVGYRQRF